MELQVHTIKRGSALRLEWQTGVEIPDGAEIRLRIGEAGLSAIIEREPEVIDGDVGRVALQLTSSETGQIGDYDVDLAVTVGGNSVYYPNAGFASVRIVDRVEDSGSA